MAGRRRAGRHFFETQFACTRTHALFPFAGWEWPFFLNAEFESKYGKTHFSCYECYHPCAAQRKIGDVRTPTEA